MLRKTAYQKALYKKSSLFLLLLVSLLNGVVCAETRYLSDKIKVWTRTGPGTNYKVKFQLEAGSRLSVLQENVEAGFVEVKDERGRTGWLKNSQLVSQKTAPYRLADAQNRLAQLEKEVEQLRPLVETNQQLQDRFAGLQVELQQLQEQNQIYRSRFNSEIFFAGGITVLVGIFLGFIIGRVTGKKQNTGWS